MINKSKIQDIASKGEKIYQSVKKDYDPKNRGKFLAIDIGSKKVYLGETSAIALDKARVRHPGKIFYVAKIGFDVAETMAHSLIFKS